MDAGKKGGHTHPANSPHVASAARQVLVGMAVGIRGRYGRDWPHQPGRTSLAARVGRAVSSRTFGWQMDISLGVCGHYTFISMLQATCTDKTGFGSI